MKNETNNQRLELIGAKVPPDLKRAIERVAIEEDRSISQVISRLLSSHPALKTSKKRRETVPV
jgi:hypothetical protein